LLEPIEPGGKSFISKLLQVLTILGKLTVIGLDLTVLILSPESVQNLAIPEELPEKTFKSIR
jgi:hypothetical protein